MSPFARSPWVCRLLVGSLLALNLIARCIGLGHASIKPLDEVFHAIVARHLLAHPLLPTLNENNFISVSPQDWQNAGVWLHKPPAALWLIAVTFKLLGVSTFALRLGSALLATSSAGLTYAIARHLFDRRTALIALLLQALNPVIEMLVHGYVFSDHVDISLLFWSELSIWLLLRTARSGSRRDAMLCGAAQGVAFLSKTFPGLIATPLALLFLCSPKLDRAQWRRAAANVGWILFATVLVAGPWNLYAWLNWPREYAAQNLGILAHLNQNVEGWAGPWDRVIADYGWRVFGLLYPSIIASTILALVHKFRRRDGNIGFVLAWLALTLIPNLLATSKPMTATLVAWPALLLLLAWLIGLAWTGAADAAIAWLIASLLPLVIPLGTLPAEGWGYPPGYHFGAILMANWRPIGFGAIASAVGSLMARWHVPTRIVVSVASIATVSLLLLPVGAANGHAYAIDFWRVSRMHVDTPDDTALCTFAARLPVQSALLVEERSKLENKIIAFESDRDCYPLVNLQWQSLADTITTRGGLAYIVADAAVDLPVAWRDPDGRRVVYAASPAALKAAGGR